MKTEPIFVEYLDHMGSDLSVVNAARASFGKESDWNYGEVEIRPHPGDPEASIWVAPRTLKPADANLIRFLATGYRTSEWDEFVNQITDVARAATSTCRDDLTALLRAYKRRAQHWAPFGHPQVSLRVRMPIFLGRQFVKHQVGAVWSEESRRYISDEPSVWFPDEWHQRPKDIKQGSGGLVARQDETTDAAHHVTLTALSGYKDMLNEGVAPEEARTILPLNMMTTVVWTGSLLFWSRVYNQRVDSHAQLAAQELAQKIGAIVAPLYPVSWEALTS